MGLQSARRFGWVESCRVEAAQQWHAADAQSECLSCKACRWRRFVRAADAQRSALRETRALGSALRIAGRSVNTNVLAGVGTSGSPAPLRRFSGTGDEHGARHRGRADRAP